MHAGLKFDDIGESLFMVEEVAMRGVSASHLAGVINNEYGKDVVQVCKTV